MAAANNRNITEPSTPQDNPKATTSRRIEELLVTENSPSVSFRELTRQEIKILKGRKKDSRRWLIAVLMLIVAGLAGWYFYVFLTAKESLPLQVAVQTEQRMEMPERPPQPQKPDNQELTSENSVVAPTEQSDAMNLPITQEQALAVAPADSPVDSEGGNTSEAISVPASEAGVPPEAAGTTAVAVESLYRVLVGPIISTQEIERTMTVLTEKGFRPQAQPGVGTVNMIRLLEGIYPLTQAQERLEELRADFPSAFLLPDGNRWALYIGSFSDRDRARRQQRALAERQIQVAQVDSQLTMTGTLLIVARTDEQTAEGIAAELRSAGLRARLELER